MPELSLYTQMLEQLWQQPVFAVPQNEKQTLLLPLFQQLHQHHQAHNQEYLFITKGQADIQSLDDLPYLAVRLFKHLSLKSIPQEQTFRVLQSSGTTTQTPANIFLDRDTSARQSKALVKIMQHSIGRQRLPMLIIDSPAVVNGGQQFSARAAGIQGVAFFGRDHTYALDGNMQPNWPVIEEFVFKYGSQPILVFGFTFMLWLHFIQQLQQQGKYLELSEAIVLHSGGWKKLEAQKVDNQSFKQEIKQWLGADKVVNFYGMAEQVGSVFTECESGYLHAPIFADVMIRDPDTLQVCEPEQEGLIQVLSVLPTSYPGFSLLTEDLGILLGQDDCDCGRKGRYFKVNGRLPKAEVRGCSDTHRGA